MPDTTTNSQAPQPAQAPELVYSTNGEDWHLGDFSELIDELHSNGEGLDLAGMTYWVGEKRQRPASWYFRHNVELLLDQARDQAWEDADEITEDFCDDVTDEAKAELDAAIKAWADKHVNVNFWTVHNIRTATITPEDLA